MLSASQEACFLDDVLLDHLDDFLAGSLISVQPQNIYLYG